MEGHHFRPVPVWELLHSNADTLLTTYLVEALSYFFFAGLAVLAIAWMGARLGQRFRIRPHAPKPGQVRREIVDSQITLAVFQLAQVLPRVGALAFGFSVDLEQPLPIWLQLATFPLIFFVHEAYFYWTHRMMHHPGFFRWMHWEHHKSKEPTVWTSYSFAIPEAVIQGSFLVFYVLIFPATTLTIVVFAFVEIIHNVMIHSGVDVFPRALVRHKWFGWMAGSIYHDLHHRTSNSNYGLYFRFWDRWMGTEHPDFEKIYDYVHSPGNDGKAYKLIGAEKREARKARLEEAAESPATP